MRALTPALQAGIIGADIVVTVELVRTSDWWRQRHVRRALFRRDAREWWGALLTNAAPGTVRNPCDPSPTPRHG